MQGKVCVLLRRTPVFVDIFLVIIPVLSHLSNCVRFKRSAIAPCATMLLHRGHHWLQKMRRVQEFVSYRYQLRAVPDLHARPLWLAAARLQEARTRFQKSARHLIARCLKGLGILSGIPARKLIKAKCKIASRRVFDFRVPAHNDPDTNRM